MNTVKLLGTISLFLLSLSEVNGQADSSLLLQLNQQIDSYVVEKNLQGLDSMYAEDFVFSHGSGRVEGKEGWLRSAARNNYPVRKHDSVKVELHPGFAVVKGNMIIQRQDKDKLARYSLKYIRVFALRKNRWVLASHSTTHEVHEN